MNDVLQQAASSAFETVFSELRAISSQLTEVAADSWATTGKLTEEIVQQMRPYLVRALQRLDGHAFSLGIILDENIIAGTSYSLSWLERAADGTIQNDSNIRYPWRGNFYEYSNADWMSLPRSSREPVIVGPYVDFDKYLLTLAVPVIVSGQFIGVAAADLRLDDFERLVAIPLSQCEKDCLIVNSEGRVVVSNTTTHPVGSISDMYDAEASDIAHYGWQVLVLSSPLPANC